ncbi:MAG TPA: response regulator [Vicinamibacterales bacterium]|nr:response regulator [Vicinamibacterales bacterium]
MIPIPHVFVVDDEEPVRNGLEKLLRAIGYPTSSFASAEEFLANDAGQDPACVLVDIRMPGMSGIDLIEELHRRHRRMPAILMTGHTDEGALQRLDALEPIGFLEKPFSVVQLKEVLARIR